MTILNEEQLDAFLTAVKQDAVRKAFFYTELTTSLRLGEICALQWNDLNLKTGALQVG